jgi:large subunit ribosomal protein L23
MGLFSRKKKEEEKPKPEETAKEAVPTGEGEIATPAGPVVKLPKGEDAHSYQIILRPIITEKGGLLEGYGQYLFKVTKNANKVEIKKAVEKLYKVKVNKVNVISVPSKFRRVGEHEGRKPGFKKAIVTLKKGDKIEIAK